MDIQMKITRSLPTTSLLAFALAAGAAGCLGDPDAAGEADTAQSQSELAGDICFTFFEHVGFVGATDSGCVSPGTFRCHNILGFMDNRTSSFTHTGVRIDLYDGAACGGSPFFSTTSKSISNLHGFGAGDRATSARFF
jgi:hypothetical protein